MIEYYKILHKHKTMAEKQTTILEKIESWKEWIDLKLEASKYMRELLSPLWDCFKDKDETSAEKSYRLERVGWAYKLIDEFDSIRDNINTIPQIQQYVMKIALYLSIWNTETNRLSIKTRTYFWGVMQLLLNFHKWLREIMQEKLSEGTINEHKSIMERIKLEESMYQNKAKIELNELESYIEESWVFDSSCEVERKKPKK